VSLHDWMAEDNALFAEDLGLSALILPIGVALVDAQAIQIVPSDPDETLATVPIAVAEVGMQRFAMDRPTVRAAIATGSDTETLRDLRAGDRFILPTGSPYAGTWTVKIATHDEAGQTLATCTRVLPTRASNDGMVVVSA